MKYLVILSFLFISFSILRNKADNVVSQIDSKAIIVTEEQALGDNSINAIAFIKPADMEYLLRSHAEIKPSNITTDKPFLRRFPLFLIEFDWCGDNDTILSKMASLFKNVSEYNVKHSANGNGYLQLWIAIIPKENIPQTVDDVLVVIRDANSIFNGTISTLLLNYRSLQLSSESLPLVRQDIQFAKRQIKNRYAAEGMKAGIILQQLNCQVVRRKEYLQSLGLTTNDKLIFMPQLPSDESKFYTTSVCVALQKVLNPEISVVLPLRIEINVLKGTYSYDQEFLRQLYSIIPANFSGSIILETIFLNQSDKDADKNNSKIIWRSGEKWLRQPTVFSKPHFGVSIYFQDAFKAAAIMLPNVVTNFRKVIVESRILRGNGTTEGLAVVVATFASFAKSLVSGELSKQNSKVFKDEIPMELMLVANIYGGDMEANKKTVVDTLFAATFGNGIYPNTVSTVLLSWSTCFENEMDCIDAGDLGKLDSTKKGDLLATRVGELLPALYYAVVYKNYLMNEKTEGVPKIGIIWEWKFCLELYYEIRYHGPSRNSTISGRLFSATDLFILKILVDKHDIVENGAESVALATSENLLKCEPLMQTVSPTKMRQSKVLFYIKLTGCNGNYAEMSELKELVKFYEMMNSWAAKENRTVIMDTAFEFHQNSLSKVQSKCDLNTAYLPSGACDCGWWRVFETRGVNDTVVLAAENRKSITLKYYEENTGSKNRPPVGDEFTSDDGTKQVLAIVLVPTILIVIVLSILTTIFVFRYRSKYILTRQEVRNFIRGNIELTEQKVDNNLTVEGTSKAESQPYDKQKYELKASTFKIDTNHCLGTGEFGSVYKGVVQRYNDQTDVAVKMMKKRTKMVEHGAHLAVKGLISEIKILSYVGEHKHIIKLEGACTANLRLGQVTVFLEFCQLGSVDKYLRSYSPEAVNSNFIDEGNKEFELKEIEVTGRIKHSLQTEMSQDLFKWAVDIAEGMEFLASKNLVHCDLAARNILLNSEKCVKISDFGLSRRLYEYTEYLKTEPGPLPWRWMSPESLRRMMFNEKTDVWAFGITLWEMYTLGDEPYPGLSWEVDFPAFLERGNHLEEPKYNERDMYSLMKRCWNVAPCNRPTFSEIRLILADYVELVAG